MVAPLERGQRERQRHAAVAAPPARGRTSWCRPRRDHGGGSPPPCAATLRPAWSCRTRGGRPGPRCGSCPVHTGASASPSCAPGSQALGAAARCVGGSRLARSGTGSLCELAAAPPAPAAPRTSDVRQELPRRRSRAGLRPVGANLTPHRAHGRPPHRARRRDGASAAASPSPTARCAAACSCSSSPPCPTCSTAPWPRRRARRRPAAPSSTRWPTASPTPSCSAASPGSSPPPSPAGSSVLPARRARPLDAHQLRAGQGRVARLRRPGRGDGAGRAHHRPRLRPPVRLAPRSPCSG